MTMTDKIPPLHTVEPIVTPDRSEYGVNRMRVDGGWLYWLSPGGAMVSAFVPDEPQAQREEDVVDAKAAEAEAVKAAKAEAAAAEEHARAKTAVWKDAVPPETITGEAAAETGAHPV